MLALSFALHITILTALFLVRTEPRKIFLPPVYTPVELVPPPVSVEKKPPRKKVVRKKVVRKKIVKKVEKKVTKRKKDTIPARKTKKRQPPGTAKKIPLDKRPKKIPEKKPAVDETMEVEKTIKAIEERVKKRQEEEAIEETIERIARKRMQEEEQREKALKEIRAQLERFDRIVIGEKGPMQRPSLSKTFELELMEYYNTIAGLIHSNWVYPEVERDNPEMVLSITIGKDGRLVGIEVEKSSNDALFDNSAIRAVRKSTPFPGLPPQLGDTLEVGIRFCLKECE